MAEIDWKNFADHASSTNEILHSIYELSEKIDHNQKEAKAAAKQQQVIEHRRFVITTIVGSIAAVAAVLSVIIAFLS